VPPRLARRVSAAGIILVLRWAELVAIRAEYAAVSLKWFQQFFTAGTSVEEEAGVCWHFHILHMVAFWAGQVCFYHSVRLLACPRIVTKPTADAALPAPLPSSSCLRTLRVENRAGSAVVALLLALTANSLPSPAPFLGECLLWVESRAGSAVVA
jgi:hypothetical protein